MSDTAPRWEGLLPGFALRRPVTVSMLVATVLVIGFIALRAIPLELLPSGFTEPSLQVQADWREAAPQEVLERITVPLEAELSTVSGISRLSSVSWASGSRVMLRFKTGTDMDVAYREVRDRVERARVGLPSDLQELRIRKHEASGIPVMVVGLVVDPTISDPHHLIRNEVVLPLQRVDGVAGVESDALDEEELVIELDRDRAAAAGIHIYSLARELAKDQFSVPSGTVESAGRRLLLRSVSGHQDLESLRQRRVAGDLRLGDLADIGFAPPARGWRVRVNGNPALALEITKEGQANTLELTQRLRRTVERLQDNPRLSGFELKVLFDQGETIRESLSTLLLSGAAGSLFAILVLFFFLRRFRTTLIITLSIPVSLLIALTAMHFAGESLNLLSLLGLMICVGLLVDNSVVVAENIHRVHRQGVAIRQACVQGAGEIALAIVLATLTTIVVFLPVSLVDGEAQFLMLRLSLPISVALAASLLVALVLIPAALVLTLADSGAERGSVVGRAHGVVDAVLGRLYRGTIGRASRAYQVLLAFFLRRRLDLMLGLVAFAALTGAVAMSGLEVVGQAEQDRRSFQVELDLPPTNDLSDTSAFFESIEEVLERKRHELGLEGYLVVFSATWGQVEGWLPKRTDWTARQVTEALLEELPKPPGVTYYAGEQQDEVDESAVKTWSLVLEGDDPEALHDVAEGLQGGFLRVPGVLGMKRDAERPPNQLALVVDRARAQRQNLSPDVIAGVVAHALRGESLPRFEAAGRRAPVRIRHRYEGRQGLAELSDLDVPDGSGGLVRLASVSEVEVRRADRVVRRSDKRVSQALTFELVDGQEEEARERLMALRNALSLPEGVSVRTDQGSRELDENVAALRFALLLSVVFIYLITCFLFESFVLPLSVLPTIPLAVLGVGWAHFFAGRDLDPLGLVGLIVLAGVVVNNGIVLVDCVHRLRREGHERGEALRLAAERRFRPILMTAATTICGMVPLALGEPTSIGMSYASFGLTLMGGLTASTLLTLLVVPVFYTFMDDASTALSLALRRAARRQRQSAPA